MKVLSSGIHQKINELYKNSKHVHTEFSSNIFVTHIIRSWQTTPEHGDSAYTPDGCFKDASNSQQKDSPVAILVIGDTRVLRFRLMTHITLVDGTIKKVPVGPEFDVILSHGTLFILDPTDERPLHRDGFGSSVKKMKTFWHHSSQGINPSDNISFGITLRTCSHFTEVFKRTGVKKLTPAEQQKVDRGIYKPHLDVLEDWCTNPDSGKAADDRDLLRRFTNARKKYGSSVSGGPHIKDCRIYGPKAESEQS